MCSIFNDEIEDSLIVSEKNIIECKDTCKCGSTEIVLRLTLYGSFCRECFFLRVAHKFRSEFGKSRLVRDNENVAVAFSCGKKSTAMVNLIKEGLSKRAQKKLRFNPTLIYIIEPIQWELSYRFDSKVVETLFSLEIPFYVFSLSQALDEDIHPLLSDKDDVEHFNQEEFLKKIDFSNFYEMRKSLKQPTSMESMHTLLKRQMLRRICNKMKLTKVLMGDTASLLAVRLISFVSQGRGGQLSYEMEFSDERNADVAFIKPMRAFLDEEVDTLLELKNLNYFKSTSKWDVQTIEKLTGDFIRKLQTENDKTLSIICRTGEKLTAGKVKSCANSKELMCLLCQAPIENSVSKLTANSAVSVSTNIADELRKNGIKGSEVFKNVHDDLANMNLDKGNCQSGCESILKINNDGRCGSLSCCKENPNNLIVTKHNIMDCLCYGCRIIIKNMNDISKLPSNFITEIQAKIRRKKMRETIEDFIFDEDEALKTF